MRRIFIYLVLVFFYCYFTGCLSITYNSFLLGTDYLNLRANVPVQDFIKNHSSSTNNELMETSDIPLMNPFIHSTLLFVATKNVQKV